MKTGQILKSSDRILFGVTVRQDTKSHFMSVTDLQKAYESARFQYGWSERRVETIMSTIDFKEKAYYVLKKKFSITTGFDAFMEDVKLHGITKVLKSIGVYKTTGARESKHVSADPYIWSLIALEMNPMLFAEVVVWLTDTLIFDRVEAGTEYRPMNTSIKSVIQNPDYFKYAIAINKRVFGKHITGIRNLASAKELRSIAELEKLVINAIEMGWVKDDHGILKTIEMGRI